MLSTPILSSQSPGEAKGAVKKTNEKSPGDESASAVAGFFLPAGDPPPNRNSVNQNRAVKGELPQSDLSGSGSGLPFAGKNLPLPRDHLLRDQSALSHSVAQSMSQSQALLADSPSSMPQSTESHQLVKSHQPLTSHQPIESHQQAALQRSRSEPALEIADFESLTAKAADLSGTGKKIPNPSESAVRQIQGGLSGDAQSFAARLEFPASAAQPTVSVPDQNTAEVQTPAELLTAPETTEGPASEGQEKAPLSNNSVLSNGTTGRHTYTSGSGPVDISRSTASELVEGVDQKVRMMFENNQQSARLQLTPTELGALDIYLRGDGDQARLSVIAHGQQARDILEQQLPRLREALDQQGIALADANVSDGSGQSDKSEHQIRNPEVAMDTGLELALDKGIEGSQSLRKNLAPGQIDYYA